MRLIKIEKEQPYGMRETIKMVFEHLDEKNQWVEVAKRESDALIGNVSVALGIGTVVGAVCLALMAFFDLSDKWLIVAAFVFLTCTVGWAQICIAGALELRLSFIEQCCSTTYSKVTQI